MYIPRAQRGRGLLSVKDCVELERSNLFDYAANNNERLLKAATEELQLRTKIDGKNKEERENERWAAWKEKALHGQLLRETEGIQDQRRWQWLKAGELKRETESIICAAQEQALRTNAIKNGIDHQGVSPLCRLCKKKIESVSSCSVLAGNQYRKRHEKLGKNVHWLLCTKFEIECEDKWLSHQPEPVLENDKCKILWDFAIQTDKEIGHRRIDIAVIDKGKRECKIINIAVLGDQNIKVKELEKNTKYQDLRLQVQKL